MFRRQAEVVSKAVIVILIVMLWAPPALYGAPSASVSAAGLTPVVVEGGDAGYAPYEFLNKHRKPAGFNIALMRKIALHEGFRVRFRLGDWNKLYKGFINGTNNIDVMPMFVSASRERHVRFAPPCLLAFHKIYGRANAPPVSSIRSLAGKWVLVQAGAYDQRYLKKYVPRANLVPVSSQGREFKLLSLGEYDYAVVSGGRGDYMLKHMSSDSFLKQVAPPLMPVRYCFGVRKGDVRLFKKIQAGLQWLSNSGEYARLEAKWLPYRATARVSFSDIVRLLSVAVGLAAMLALLYAVWLWVIRGKS